MQQERHSFTLNAYTKKVLQFVEEYGQFSCLISGYHREDLLVGRQGQVLRRVGQLGKDLTTQLVCRGYVYTQVRACVVEAGEARRETGRKGKQMMGEEDGKGGK